MIGVFNMTKLHKAIIIVLILQIIIWIGFAVWVFIAGTNAAGEAGKSAAEQGANNGSIIGGAIGGSVVAVFSELAIIFFTIAISVVAIITLIILLIYIKKKEFSIFGGIITFIFSSPIVGILMIIERCINKKQINTNLE